jgi:mannose-6-phosphate isomerase-like protein (cupin superfamily)
MILVHGKGNGVKGCSRASIRGRNCKQCPVLRGLAKDRLAYRAWLPPLPSQNGAPSVAVISAKNNGVAIVKTCKRLVTTLISSKASIICAGCLIDLCSSKKRRPGGGNEIQKKSGALNVKTLVLFFLLLAHGLGAQERQTDPTWLHRYLPDVSETKAGLTSPTCHYRAMFGEGDKENRAFQTVTRFGEVSLDRHGNCETVFYDREEEIYFVVEGAGMLHYQNQVQALRKHDFTYLPPGVKHSIANHSDQPLRVLVMGFKIPSSISIGAPTPYPKIANLEDAKEETVSGHPNSVLYKLLIGLHTGKRDLIDEAYVMNSFFWMDFAPGGTNWPHHHEAAEEIYLVVDGHGEIVAGGGTDGVEGRHAAKAGDAYYFRPNCTVGFYNQDKPGAKAYILAVRSRVPMHEDEE